METNTSANHSIVVGVPDYEDFYNRARFATGLVLYPITCAVGLLSNVLILVVLVSKARCSSTDVLLAALAVSDGVKLLNDVLYFVTCLLLALYEPAGQRLYAHLYPYAHFVFNMSVCVSSWLTVALALERYVLVCHPARAKTLTSVGRSRRVIVAVYVLMSAVAIPSALRYRTVEVVRVVVVAGSGVGGGGSSDGNKTGSGVGFGLVNETAFEVELAPLWRDERFSHSYNWLQSLLRSIVPLVVLVATSCVIVTALRRTRASGRKLAARNRITVMLTVVIASFIVCIIPDAVMSALYLGYTESDSFLVKGVREITDLLLAVNAATNFFLYVVFNKGFRDSFLAQFCRRGAVWTAARRGRRRSRDSNVDGDGDDEPSNHLLKQQVTLRGRLSSDRTQVTKL